ncbi:PAS domain S-box protein [Bacillus infantis]|uniref:STAS domain-containing protein n=1 Tax=Bacillus infantis TaxID=324767 RepID=UPI001CD35B0F|nr:STAS domain-containing protein [Bacillus infantis]MCA1038088.1 PAS domain S-box protein [Bacillus infantis]
MDSIVLDHLSVAVMAIDEHFTIKVANKRCKEILGIDPEEAIGQNIDEFFGHPPEFTRTVQHTLEQGKNFRYDVFPYTWGKYELTLSQRSTLLKDDNNNIKGAMVEFEDITERHKMEEQYKNFIEESTVNIILVDDKIGMLSLHALPYDVSPAKMADLAAKAMQSASQKKIRALILDMSKLFTIKLLANAVGFVELMQGFRMIGIEVVFAGIRPDIAVQSVQAGIRLEGVETFPQLDTAIRHLKEKY